MPGVLILRLDSPILYYYAISVRDRIKDLVASLEPAPQVIILDAVVQDRLDVTGAHVLRGLGKELQDKGMTVFVAELHTPVAQFARRVGVTDSSTRAAVF